MMTAVLQLPDFSDTSIVISGEKWMLESQRWHLIVLHNAEALFYFARQATLSTLTSVRMRAFVRCASAHFI